MRKKYGITVVGVMQGEKMDLSFDPQTPLPGNVILVLIGANKILEKIMTVMIKIAKNINV